MSVGGQRSGAATSLYGLVVALLILPLLVLAAGMGFAWRSTVAGVREELQSSATLTAEAATRALGTQLLLAARVKDLTDGHDDPALMADSASLRHAMLAMARQVPWIGGVAVVDAQGRVIFSSGMVSINPDQMSGLLTRNRPFAISGPDLAVAVPRGSSDGPFRGAVVVTASPDFLKATGGDTDRSVGLYRLDGTVLASFPHTGLPGLPEAPVMPSGIMRADGDDRLIAWHQLDTYPVYVAIERSSDSIVAIWWRGMRGVLAFGAAATGSLAALGLLAIAQARREGKLVATLARESHLREYADTALRQAQRLEAVGRLTGGIAHDFNNHLTVISSNIELLKYRLSSTKDFDRFVDAALLAVQRAATLTHKLLRFSRQQPQDPEPLDVGRLVFEMLDLLRRTLGESIRIQTDFASGLWPTRVDAGQLEAVLLNLAINARDAMPEGGTLTITTTNWQSEETQAEGGQGQYVAVSVADSRRDAAADVSADPHEPFVATGVQREAPGLGLSMVHGFASQSGGHVQVASDSGRGFAVKLYLPRFVPAPSKAREAQMRDRPMRKGAGETILVVEDDEVVRRASVEVLKELGYRVLEAPDAMEAFRMIVDRGGIDLLFTDVGLPGGVNGHALADAVRNVDSEIKLLFTTGHARMAEVDYGDVPILAKPFDLRQLASVVRNVLDAPSPREKVRVAAGEKA